MLNTYRSDILCWSNTVSPKLDDIPQKEEGRLGLQAKLVGRRI